MKTTLIFLSSTLLFVACNVAPAKNPYNGATPAQLASFKRERLPLPARTSFLISQGAFGSSSHAEKGNEYSWDFDVPYGTPVVSVENGVVLSVWEPKHGGRFSH